MKRKIRQFTASILFCAILIGCGKFFRYILIDDTTSYTRITFHEMYEQDNIDVLFVGSSHCYRSFVPKILDETIGANTFNGGTSSQDLDGSYMIIKEAARYYNIEHIYLELYYNCAFNPKYKSRTDMTQTYIISDYLRPSLDKVLYLLNASTNDHYPNSFILARRNWSKIFDADYVRELIAKKGTDLYKNYEYVTEKTEWYSGKGYVSNPSTVEDWNYFSTIGWCNINFNYVSEDWVHSLKSIIAFCDRMGIPLTLVSAPMSNFMLAGIENYDEYMEVVQSIIAGTDVDYYDFNLCKEEYFPNTSHLFKDEHHMNCYGAEEFSRLFADFINGEIPEDELFYGSYHEKLAHLEPTVFGISYHDGKDDSGEQVRNCKIVSTGNDNLEYEIMVSPSEGELYKIQDFSSNKFFTLVPKDHGIITVAYRLSNSPNEVWTIDVSY